MAFVCTTGLASTGGVLGHCICPVIRLLLQYSVLTRAKLYSEKSFINLIYTWVSLHNTIQYNAIQYNTIQYNTIQYNTIQYNTIQYNTIQYNTIQYNTIQYNTMQYNTIQYNTI